MTTYFSDLKPPQTECVFAKHLTREEQLDQMLKLLAQGSTLEPQSRPKDRR